MQTRDITYTQGGKTLTGYLADGSNGAKAPGILVCHQGGGLRDHEKTRARMLAELGYVAFALDMYGEVVKEREDAMRLLNQVSQDQALWGARIHAGLDQLVGQPNVDAARLGAIGFCFGGMTVIEAVRATDALKCVVAFHPGLTHLPESDPRPVHGKVMVCAGQKDPLIPDDARNRFLRLMADAKVDLQYINYSQAGHSFTDESVAAFNMPNFEYHEPTDRRSWAAMRALFAETFA
ncbi:MAG TPA: dienelactone hydrolase family protein [Rhizomicrobium sp.]|jgi:dienelactone hydrolase|nr:dienelactone hydrolase family protein [Rhizomicrobium sp.]